MSFIKSQYSIEELEQFRDENGYIDISQTDISLENSENDSSREKIGNTDRFKNWVDFLGTKVLLKEEIKLEEKRNFGIYSELIMEELAKQMGLEAAKTDLIKYNGRYGISSEMVLNPEIEEMETIYSIVGDTTLNEENPDTCNFEEVEAKLIQYLKKLDMIPEEINNLINERRKQHVLRLVCGETDGHLENESIIRYKTEDGRIVARMAPMFDNETSFLLDMDEMTLSGVLESNEEDNIYKEQLEKFIKKYNNKEQLEDLLKNDDEFKLVIFNLKNMGVTQQEIAEILEGNQTLRTSCKGRGKTVFIPTEDEIEDYPYDSITDNTLAYIRDLEEPEIDNFFEKIYSELDIEAAIEAVEKKIRAPIPQIVKDIVVPFIEMRKKTLDDILWYREPCETMNQKASLIHRSFIKKKQDKAVDYSEQITKRSVDEGISLNEAKKILEQLATPVRTSGENNKGKDIDKKDEVDEPE